MLQLQRKYFICDSFQETRGRQNVTEFLKLNILFNAQ